MRLSFLITLFILPISIFSQCPITPSVGCNGDGTSLDLYWVGTETDNSGMWNTPCSWRVGSTSGVEPCQAPRSIDNVFFNASGFTAGGSPVITINSQARCDNFKVDPSINSLGFAPEFSLVNPGFVEIYGSFELQSNITWDVVGGNTSGPEMLFKSSNIGNTITTAGHTLGALQFDGIGGEWSLQDEFNAGSLNFVFGYLNTSDGVNDHDMNLLTFDSDVKNGGSSANRRIDFNSSVVTLTSNRNHDRYPYNTTNAPKTVWECRGTDAGDLTFNAGTSKIIFTATNPFLRLGGLSYNVIQHTGTGYFYDHFGPDPCSIDTLETDGYLFFHHEHVFNVVKINSVSKKHSFFRHQTITGDLIVSGSPCNPTIFSSEYNRLLTMPSSVSADPMVGFQIDNLRCSDGTSGHAVSGFGQGNTAGWNITPPASRDLYWVGNTNNNWGEPTNWSTSNTGSPLLSASGCPPMQTDNVFFIPALANGDNININQESYCNNQTWSVTSSTTLSGNGTMNVYGNLTLDANMNFNTWSKFNFYGTTNHSITTAGNSFNSHIYFWDGTDYTLQDDVSFNNIYLQRQTNFSTGGNDLTGNRIYFRVGISDFSGSLVTLNHSIPWNIRGSQGTMIYDNQSQVIFTNTSETTEIYGWGPGPHLPNFTLQSPNTTLRFRDHLKNRDCIFEGDVILNGSARFYGDLGTGVTPGDLRNITFGGDLTVNAGEKYEFGSNNTVTVGGDVTALGLCSDYIDISGIDGSTFGFSVSGTTVVDYSIVSDVNATTTIVTSNSLDAGNNTNVTFPSGGGLTYYWRAKVGTCPSCVYNGDWSSTDGFWSTNAGDNEGVAGCTPGPRDNVVFDNKSFSGGQSTVNINSLVICHDLIVTASNARLYGSGNLKITGSVISDGTVDLSTFWGDLDFLSNDTSGETIDFGGASTAANINFANVVGSWALANNHLTTNKTITLQAGTLNTNGQTVNMKTFNSNNTSQRNLILGSSVINISGSGNFVEQNSPYNIYSWDTKSTTNLSVSPGTSTINFTSSSEPTIKSHIMSLNDVNFVSTSSNINVSPVLDLSGVSFGYVKFNCSARIFGNNKYDTLHFTSGNVYQLESNRTQTLNAPNGMFIATGTAGNEISLTASVTGIPSILHKKNSGGSLSSFCIDYISVEDNNATSDDAAFAFFAGINSNNISATGLWDFTRPAFILPSIDSGSDQFICSGASADITWDITGSGPYDLTFTENGSNPTTVTIPHGETSYTTTVNPSIDTEYLVSIFQGDNCNAKLDGTVLDNSQDLTVPTVSGIGQNSDEASCYLNNDNSFVHFQESINGTERVVTSVLDKSSGIGLGSVTAKVEIDASVQYRLGEPYLQRRYGISPTNNEDALVRLYFTQTELDALSTALGTTLSVSDLMVTKYDNELMDFSGTALLLQPTSSGSIPSGITNSLNVKYIEVDISSFSHFVIHGPSLGPLPIELLSFEAKGNGSIVDLDWSTATETNNDFFTIEKSQENNQGELMPWDIVAHVDGAGNSVQELKYHVVDNDPYYGVSYYRLKQTDFDGNFEYSYIRSVYFANSTVSKVLVYPNPAKDKLFIESDSESLKYFSVINGQSQNVEGMIEIIEQNDRKIILDISRMTPGMYIIKTGNTATKFVKE